MYATLSCMFLNAETISPFLPTNRVLKGQRIFLRQRKALLWRQVFPMGRGEILLIATIRECIGMEFLGENAILEFNAVGLHWF